MSKAAVYSLSQEFYSKYTKPPYNEILDKPARPYCCIVVDCGRDYLICIPYRSNIKHKYAYMFRNSERSKRTNSGLDYSKIVIISKNDQHTFLSSNAVVDRDEYTETFRNINTIISDAAQYVDDFVAHNNGTKALHIREYERRYKLSTLKYFSNELGLKNIIPKPILSECK